MVAAGLTGAAVLLVSTDHRLLTRRLGTSAAAATEPRRGWWLLGIGILGTVGWLVVRGGPRQAVLLLLIGVGAWAVRRLVQAERRRRIRTARQRSVVEFCDALSAELRSGVDASSALRRACAPWPELGTVARAARLGGDVPAGLRLAAERPGGEGLRALAAGWEVASGSGAALAAVLDRLAEGLRSDADARAEVQAALGPPRATAKMLAALPLFGVSLGISMGAHPLGFLFGSSLGLGCLTVGLVLATLGVLWVERLADSVQP